MRTVHRYPIEIKSGPQMVQWRKGGEIRLVGQKSPDIIDVKTEFGTRPTSFIDLWVEIDDEIDDFDTRHFEIVGTGHPIPRDAEFMGSIVQRSDDIFGGALVWHVYEHKI